LRVHEKIFYRRYPGSVLCISETQLINVVDVALNEAANRSGAWLACRPGCCQCCIGVFPITQSDALRLRQGLAELATTDPQRAANVSERARAADLTDFPGDPITGILGEDPASQARFEQFGDDHPCPALDPHTGKCDLYDYRPITCRTFGPALRLNSDSVDLCELCYDGATEEEILACQVDLDLAELDQAAEREAEETTRLTGQTIVAFALRSPLPAMPARGDRPQPVTLVDREQGPAVSGSPLPAMPARGDRPQSATLLDREQGPAVSG
jgi:Fe-S-cluster containining protein